MVENVALVSGGGVYAIDSNSLRIDRFTFGEPTFVGNIAPVGGALFLKDCQSAEVHKAGKTDHPVSPFSSSCLQNSKTT